jgi:hypothetical protein
MVVDELGIEGTSSDESEVDENNKKCFRIKRHPWRSKLLDKFLRRVDRDRNTTSAYGNALGNRPRTRKRPAYSDSIGDAVPGLPMNFYDPNWYRKLSDWDKEDLDAGEDVEMPEYEEDV